MKTITVPKGLKNGSTFRSGGKVYIVISYRHPTSGKLVRFARLKSKMMSALKKAQAASKRKTGTKRKSTAKRKTSTKRTTAKKSTAKKAVTIPKGKRVGQVFKKQNKYYMVATVPTAKGGKRRYARQISAATAKAKCGMKTGAKKKTTKRKTTKRKTSRRSNPGGVNRSYIPGIGYI